MTTRVVVYGTLKRDGRLNPALETSSYLGEMETKPEFTMVNLGWFPGVLHRGTTSIHGEVFEIDKDTLKRLDGIEGYPTLYQREEIDTPYGVAQIYIYNLNSVHHAFNVVSDGNWKNNSSVGG